jgi:hypothetical protein
MLRMHGSMHPKPAPHAAHAHDARFLCSSQTSWNPTRFQYLVAATVKGEGGSSTMRPHHRDHDRERAQKSLQTGAANHMLGTCLLQTLAR